MIESEELGLASRVKTGRPLGVTLLAVWEFLNGLQLLIFGLAVLSYSGALAEGTTLKGLVFLIAVVTIVLSLWKLVLARGYIKGYESARRRGRSVALFAVLMAVLGVTILKAILDLASPLWTIVANLGIFWYLGSDKVVRFFKGRSRQ